MTGGTSATAATVSVDAPKAEAQVAGKVDTVAVTEKAEGAKATVDKTAEVKTVTVEAPKAETQVAGKVDTVAVAETAEGAKATVDKGAEVKDMTVAAPNTETQVAGKVDNVAVAETAKDVTVNTSSSAQVGNVTTEAEGTKVSGSGKVDSVTATGSADNTSVTTPGTKTENKTEGGSMTDGKGNETKPGESGTSSGSSGGSGSSSSGGGSGTTTPTHTHTWSEWTVITPATCTEKGSRTRTCTAEGCTDPAATETEEIPATGHTYTKGTVIMADETSHKKVCDTCGDDTATEAHNTENVNKTCACGYKPTAIDEGDGSCGKDHVWDEGTENPKATCTTPGTKTYHCTNKVVGENSEEKTCTATKTESIPALGHELVDDTEKNQANLPTCIQKGMQGYKKCSRDGCDYVVVGTEVPALGHSYDEGKVTKEPTCKDAGVKTFTCTRTGCTADTEGHTKTENIPATGKHAAANATWEKDNTKHWHVCATEGCNEKVDEANHDWSNKNGTCKVCSQTCPNTTDHANILTTATCPTCGAAGTKEETPVTPATYTISVVSDSFPDGCSIQVKVGNGEVTSAAEGVEVSLIPKPADGWRWKGGSLTAKNGEKSITLTQQNDNNRHTFTMPNGPVTVTAEFEKIEYTLSVVATNKDDSITFKVGDNQNATKATMGDTVTVVIPDGKTATKVAYTTGEGTDEAEVTAATGGTYTFTMPAADVTVTVTFVEAPATI